MCNCYQSYRQEIIPKSRLSFAPHLPAELTDWTRPLVGANEFGLEAGLTHGDRRHTNLWFKFCILFDLWDCFFPRQLLLQGRESLQVLAWGFTWHGPPAAHLYITTDSIWHISGGIILCSVPKGSSVDLWAEEEPWAGRLHWLWLWALCAPTGSSSSSKPLFSGLL